MGDDIGSGLLFMAVCFDFCSSFIVQLSNRNIYFYQFRCPHPLIAQLSQDRLSILIVQKKVAVYFNYFSFFDYSLMLE